jgi:hypothetical protein
MICVSTHSLNIRLDALYTSTNENIYSTIAIRINITSEYIVEKTQKWYKMLQTWYKIKILISSSIFYFTINKVK